MLPLETKSKLLWTFIVVAPTCTVTLENYSEVNPSDYIAAIIGSRKHVH